ncbi:hypothetical protein OHQ89_35480 [Streptomyces canus]
MTTINKLVQVGGVIDAAEADMIIEQAPTGSVSRCVCRPARTTFPNMTPQ